MDIERVLAEVAASYPDQLAQHQVRDIPRIAFNIRLALNGDSPKNKSICDIGGGVGLFSVGCAALGMRVVLVVDFADPVNMRVAKEPFVVHSKYGVTIYHRDVIRDGVKDIPGGFDVVTTFDSMEHWHNSPRNLFRQITRDLLSKGGRFVLGVPNCVNMRKRITVPFGIGKWSPMQEWYGDEIFRGHVREPDVGDLRYIAQDMGLRDVRIHGRNWLGYFSSNPAIRAATIIADHPLRLFPSLCSDLYMSART